MKLCNDFAGEEAMHNLLIGGWQDEALKITPNFPLEQDPNKPCRSDSFIRRELELTTTRTAYLQ